MSSSLAYRPDIDGMRAIAVIAVVLFHLDIAMLAGGFVGVDVFFVISGYLITSIIWSKKAADKFSLKDFYLGRVRRLLPPLYVTVFATFIGAAFIMVPEDFARFSRSAIAAIFSVSNINFYLEAGYWDTASHLKPLLHTWSLGVEEQFYLIWPVFVLFCATILRRVSFPAILLATSVIGFAVTWWYTGIDPSGAFYLFPFRIFQFAFGAFVAFAARDKLLQPLLTNKLATDALTLSGIAITIACCFLYDAETPFPGLYALPPTLGAGLMLIGGSQGRLGIVSQNLLTNPVSTFLGRVSYAMYLVHWPIIVLYRYATGSHFTILEQVALGLATLIGAVLLHYLIERRFYRRDHAKIESKKHLSSGQFAWRTLAIGALCSLVAGHVLISNGWAWRFPNIALTPEQIEAGKKARFDLTSKACNIRDYANGGTCPQAAGTSVNVLLFGNSHEPDAYNFLHAGYQDDPNLNFIIFGTINLCGQNKLRQENGRWRTDHAECQSRLDTLFSEEFAQQIDILVYIANKPFGWNKDTFLTQVEELKALNPEMKVIVFGGYLNTRLDCSRLIIESGHSNACRAAENVTYFEADVAKEGLYGKFAALADHVIDRVDLHCKDRKLETCETQTPNGVPFAYDVHHISREFAEYGGKLYARKHPDLFRELYAGMTRKQTMPTPTPAVTPVTPEPTPSPKTSTPILPKDGVLSFDFVAQNEDVKALHLVRIKTVPTGVEVTLTGKIDPNVAGGRTGVAHVVLSPEQEAWISGKSARITFTGTATTATDVLMQYSTREVGNSGWRRANVSPGNFSVSFDYNVPVMRNGLGDYIGIAPLSAPIIVNGLKIELLE